MATGITKSSTLETDQQSEFIDTITYKVVSRMPAGLDPNPKTSPGGRRQIKPRKMQVSLPSRSAINKVYNVYLQEFDNYVQFDLFTRTNFEAEEFIEWFEDFMFSYTGLFIHAGVGQIDYFHRLEDTEITKWRTGLSVRSVRYYIRTQKLLEEDEYKIKQIKVQLLQTLTAPAELETYQRALTQRDAWEAVKAAFCDNS